MPMFDYVRCEYPLPTLGVVGLQFQTKDFDAPWLNEYEIRADGTLWRQDYDIEDRSDPNAEGLMRLAGSMTRVNPRWVPETYTGAVRFYTDNGGRWLEFTALFKDGALQSLVDQSRPTPTGALTP